MDSGTGAVVTVMREQTYKTTWNAEKAPPMQPTILTCNCIFTQVTLYLIWE